MDFSNLPEVIASLGVHGAMALIIIAQLVLMIKAIDLIRKDVVPLWSNHFKHVEDAFDRMSEQYEDHKRMTEQQTEVMQNQNTIIQSQGKMLRALLRDIEGRSK